MDKMNDRQPGNEQGKGFDPIEEKILRRIPWEILLASFCLAIGALIFFNALAGLFFFAGGVFAAANFLWLQRAIFNILLQRQRKALQSGILLYLVRLLLILAVFSIIILFHPRQIFAFAAGFSTLLLVFLAEAIAAFLRIKQWKN
jgi:hypothetical protein